jgi:hypothetical protein
MASRRVEQVMSESALINQRASKVLSLSEQFPALHELAKQAPPDLVPGEDGWWSFDLFLRRCLHLSWARTSTNDAQTVACRLVQLGKAELRHVFDGKSSYFVLRMLDQDWYDAVYARAALDGRTVQNMLTEELLNERVGRTA